MLREHLDEGHGAASRVASERALQIDWFWNKLSLGDGVKLLDLTCGPGLYAVPLAQAGCRVDGVDFGPAAIQYAKELAETEGVSARCRFVESDILTWGYPEEAYQAALILYGQLAVMPRDDAEHVLKSVASSLVPGGKVCIELLNQDRVDKEDSSWWFTDESGLWGDAPFLVLGERKWYPQEMTSMERYYVTHLESGRFDEIILCDQTYSVSEMVDMLKSAGFSDVSFHYKWDDLALYDADEWVVYIATR